MPERDVHEMRQELAIVMLEGYSAPGTRKNTTTSDGHRTPDITESNPIPGTNSHRNEQSNGDPTADNSSKGGLGTATEAFPNTPSISTMSSKTKARKSHLIS